MGLLEPKRSLSLISAATYHWTCWPRDLDICVLVWTAWTSPSTAGRERGLEGGKEGEVGDGILSKWWSVMSQSWLESGINTRLATQMPAGLSGSSPMPTSHASGHILEGILGSQAAAHLTQRAPLLLWVWGNPRVGRWVWAGFHGSWSTRCPSPESQPVQGGTWLELPGPNGVHWRENLGGPRRCVEATVLWAGSWALDQSRFFLAWSLTPPWAPGTLGLESGPETFCEIFSVTLRIIQVRNHALEATLVV